MLLIYSSRTGNTKKVAEKIAATLGNECVLKEIEEDVYLDNEKNIIIGFWVDKNNADEKMQQFLKKLHHKNIIFFATMGAIPDVDYCNLCMKNVWRLLDKDNKISDDYFVCQGKIDPVITERLITAMNDINDEQLQKRLQAHRKAAMHPTQDDLAAAAVFTDKIKDFFAQQNK